MTTLYYKLEPEKIFDDIVQSNRHKKIYIKGREYFVCPHVYPSDKFRTTNFLLDSIQPYLENASVCDMGCGMGIVGLFSLEKGAKKVTQADINPLAVKNARKNAMSYNYTSDKIEILESDCFKNIPTQAFDIIVFNIPFHSEPHQINDPLEYAFHDPDFTSTKNFLVQAHTFSHQDTKIFIAFSNKGDVEKLENIFEFTGYDWKLWKTTNEDQKYDNRIYLLSIPKQSL